jgi:Na+/H+-dicarboxylate symporter
MMISATIGLTTATLLAPGLHLTILQHTSSQLNVLPNWQNIIVDLIPESPIKALADGNILQILVFALIFGCAINAAGEPAKPIAEFFRACSIVVNKLVMMVMSFAPIGIFALIAVVSGEFGLAALASLLSFVFSVYLSCFILLVLFSLILFLGLRLDPRLFFKGAISALLLAFTTSSSAATFPVTIQCAEKNMGIPHHLAAFLLPLGSTLNLNGLSIYLGAAVVFAANLAGVHLSIAQYLMVAVTISLTAAGAGAIPGSAIIVMGAIFSSVGIPLSAIALIAGVDRLNDMAQTATNVAGDLFATTLVAEHEKAIDKMVYYRLPKIAI